MPPEPSSVRTSTIAAVADRLVSLRLAHPVRVAVDGRTASGKTTFADELASAISSAGRAVIRASVDGFRQPSVVRHRQGRLSPDGYCEDARDLNAIRTLLLDPFGPDGDRSYATQSFDLERDEAVEPDLHKSEEDAHLIVDGTFLQRPELRPAWDFVVFLDVAEEESLRRGIDRDCGALGGRERASEIHRRRYAPAFARYELECNPADRADAVIDNTVCASATLVRLR